MTLKSEPRLKSWGMVLPGHRSHKKIKQNVILKKIRYWGKHGGQQQPECATFTAKAPKILWGKLLLRRRCEHSFYVFFCLPCLWVTENTQHLVGDTWGTLAVRSAVASLEFSHKQQSLSHQFETIKTKKSQSQLYCQMCYARHTVKRELQTLTAVA